jgi:hypothetical protein
MSSEIAHGCAQNAQNGFGVCRLFRAIPKDGDEFLNHIVRVTGDETWVSYVNVEIKEQSKQWMHTHSPNKPQEFKQTLSACEKADKNCYLGHGRSADGGIHATRDHNNVSCALRNTKKNCVGPAIQNKRRGMLTYGIILLHDNAVRIQLLAL